MEPPVARAAPGSRARGSRQLDVGTRLRQHREALGLSLRQLGRRTGFSASFLSQVELGQASPSLASLARIVTGLGLELADLLAGGLSQPDLAPSPVIQRRDETVVRSDWSHATLRLLLPPSARRPVSVVLIGIDPSGQSGRAPHARPGGTFAFCVAGRATLVTPDETHELAQGDSVYYGSNPFTHWRNDGHARAELLVVALPEEPAHTEG